MNTISTNVQEKHCKLLLHYCIAPHATTNISPELFLQKKLRTRLDLLFSPQEENKDRVLYKCHTKSFERGEQIACRNYVRHDK